MYGFRYNFIQKNFNAELPFTDTDSLISEIKSENLYEEFFKWKDWTVCSCHVMYAVQSESTFYSSLNVKELLAGRKNEICRWSDYKWTRTQNHLVLKGTLTQLPKVTKWLSCVLSTNLYGGFHCMFFSCQVRASEWIHTL